jgi:signal transduction histidine kinase/DNA-binding response OmpR family regulator
LTKFNFKTKEFRRLGIRNPDNLQFGTGAGEVIEETEGTLWTNSYAGLIKYELNSGAVQRFKHEKTDLFSVPSNHINKIHRDRSGVLWIATDNGISYLSPKNRKFNHPYLQYDFSEDPELLISNITALAKTSEETLWIGTDKGLFYSGISDNHLVKRLPGLENADIWSLSAGKNNDLWIGTYGKGFYQFNTRTRILLNLTDTDPRKAAASRNFVKSILHDAKGNVWIGFWGLGLSRLNPLTGEYKTWLHVPEEKNSISHNDIWTLFEDSKGRIWIGTNGGGLNLYTGGVSGEFISFSADTENKPGLSSNNIYSICEGKTGSTDSTILWIGTSGGLNKIVIYNVPDNEISFLKFTALTTAEGLADNSVKSIVEDDAGNLWLGTGSGISLFDPEKREFINFSKEDGIEGTDFNLAAAVKTNEGLILMGSRGGLNYFLPSAIKLSDYKPLLFITDIQIFNKSVSPGSNSPISSNISWVKEITIPYSDNVFSFEFAALDYSSPGSIQYAYMMNNFDKDWIMGGDRRFVTYTNLDPGEYTFKVKSTNSDKIWQNNITSLKIIVTPPWWRSYWALILYVTIFIMGVFSIVKFQLYRNRIRNDLKIREFEALHLREVEKMKSRFYQNISHEFRTPLTLIKGPIEQLLGGKIKENRSDYYRMILRNAERLQNLIDELLELSKLETESIPVKKDNYELVSLLRSLTYSFVLLSEQNRIEFSFIHSVSQVTAPIDRDKLEKIINNLLGNAFKYTPPGGRISIDLTVEDSSNNKRVVIAVSDTGIGIPNEHQTKIFDRFHKVDSERNIEGFGIGLALVKELVNLLNWDIYVESKEGEGSVFKLTIPLTNDEYQDKQISDPEIIVLAKKLEQDYDEYDKGETERKTGNPVILIVEDSTDVRTYLYDLLKGDYKVLLSDSAERGMELAQQIMPELIISDIMMPGMNGIEFCHKIKTCWQTSHIPVMLLTAKAGLESKVEGLETGADDYLTKPFSFEELTARAKNLINQRKHLREKFSKDINIQPASLSTNSMDKEFIEKIMKVVEQNIEKEKFNSQTLAEEMFISKRQLHRKLLALTGKGPGEFIRIVRLKKAAQLLIENKFSVTQVAYEVGFGSPAQFTRAFKKYYNSLPSEYNPKTKFPFQ